MPAARSPLTGAWSFWPDPIFKSGSVPPPGFATRRRPGKKARLKTPTATSDAGSPVSSTPKASPRSKSTTSVTSSTARPANASAIERQPKSSAKSLCKAMPPCPNLNSAKVALQPEIKCRGWDNADVRSIRWSDHSSGRHKQVYVHPGPTDRRHKNLVQRLCEFQALRHPLRHSPYLRCGRTGPERRSLRQRLSLCRFP